MFKPINLSDLFQHPRTQYIIRKFIACLIITAFLMLIIVVGFKIIGNYLYKNTDLPMLAAANPNLMDYRIFHRNIKIFFYLLLFLIVYRANFHLRPLGNLILFFGLSFYTVYFSVFVFSFIRNLPKESYILKHYANDQYTEINYLYQKQYCQTKNKTVFNLCEPSLICSNLFYDCLYGCQSVCAPAMKKPFVARTRPWFKVVPYQP